MYNQRTSRGPARNNSRSGATSFGSGARGTRPAGRRNPQAGSAKKGRFTGAYIDPKMFINKAVAPKPVEEKVHVVKALFADLAINDQLKQAIIKRGYEHPTDIQAKTIPHILEGKDVIGLANTGTGKTGAFLIPMINKIIADPKQKLLVVVPTRELAIQIQEEFVALVQGLRLQAVVVVGGANIRPQIQRLRSRHNVVIGTPGRLKDLITRKDLKLETFTNVVLDEADRMLDMGFISDVKLLMSLLASPRQTLLFSATLSREIEALVAQFQTDPVRISIKTQETSAQIDQDIVRVGKDDDKMNVLQKLLAQTTFQKILIFTRTKRGAEKLSKLLFQMGFKAESIHGDKSHHQRQRALLQFKNGQVEILVATDVAARGLDIPNVSHVINFDVPASYEDYIHRIGRTGRAGKTGVALTFIE
ncbi:MAG: DEAD/DEAH box helicase [Parcubacteria group bacterium]|jgi:superfamily II DNA/RNA helicase